MSKLNFDGSVYIGTPAGDVGITMDNQTSLITYNGGLINTGGYVHPINSISGGIPYTLLPTDSIILVSSNESRGSANILYLGTQSSGKTIYIRRVDTSLTGWSVQVGINGSLGSDTIRLSATSSVTSFNVAQDSAYTLAYSSGTWWMVRNGGSATFIPGPP